MSDEAPALPDLLGNRDVRRNLARLVAAERLHPCLLFEGPAGVGKATTARWMAMLANCEQTGNRTLSLLGGPPSPDDEPCGHCWSCRQILKGGHPDVIEVGLDPELTAPIISVKQARELTSALVLRPYQARRRFVILDPADAMGPEAANALLKTFEEPPTDTGFVLVTAASSGLLATVRSRSQRVRFGPVASEELVPWLGGRGLAEPKTLALLSGGCPGRALLLADGGIDALRTARNEALDALAGGVIDVLDFSEKVARGERAAWAQRVGLLLDALGWLLRDAVVVLGGGGGPLVNADALSVVQAWAAGLGSEGVGRLSDRLAESRRDLERYVNGRLLVDVLMAHFATELGRARLQATAT